MGEDLKGTIPFLLSISHDPLIAEYVEDLDLWDRFRDPTPVDMMSEGDIMKREWINDLSSLILQSACMHEPDASLYNLLHELDAVGGLEALCLHMTITLLAVLPNLRKLTPTSAWDLHHAPGEGDRDVDDTPSWSLLKTLVNRANDAQDATRPLQNLEVVRPCAGVGYGNYIGMYTLGPLMAVP